MKHVRYPKTLSLLSFLAFETYFQSPNVSDLGLRSVVAFSDIFILQETPGRDEICPNTGIQCFLIYQYMDKNKQKMRRQKIDIVDKTTCTRRIRAEDLWENIRTKLVCKFVRDQQAVLKWQFYLYPTCTFTGKITVYKIMTQNIFSDTH